MTDIKKDIDNLVSQLRDQADIATAAFPEGLTRTEIALASTAVGLKFTAEALSNPLLIESKTFRTHYIAVLRGAVDRLLGGAA